MNMKKKIVAAGVVGLLVGFILMGSVAFLKSPDLMLLEDLSKYDFETSVEKFEQAVVDNGWKVVKIHDMQATLAGFGHDIKAVKIFELCSSRHSVRILELDDERVVSALMPCRVAIYEKSDGKVYVSRMNSQLMAIPMGGVIAEVMGLAAAETEAILNSILAN